MAKSSGSTIPTVLTEMLGIRIPIVAAPMFLVSNEDLVVEASEFGALGAFPALNFRPIERYREALAQIRRRTKRPIAVNVIVNKSNTRQRQDLKYALEAGVEVFITSLGSPKEVIAEAHRNGARVFCDVTNLEHGLKVQDLGADGVIAVSHGAGGHAGPLSPLVLIPWLKSRLSIPVIAAGGVSHGSAVAACLVLGAAGVSVGTRFIASREAGVDAAYKRAVVEASPEDIVLTTRISGTPAAVINTPYVQSQGTELPWILRRLKENAYAKKYAVPLVHALGMRQLERAATRPTWKSVWSAGQSVGLVEDVLSVCEILEKLTRECREALASAPKA